MIKKSRFYLMLLLTLLGVSGAVAQDQVKTREAQEIEAYTYLNSFDYTTAYKLFDKLNAKYPKERDYEEKLGICCVYFPEKKSRANEIFQHLS
jgi:hypothetical protein